MGSGRQELSRRHLLSFVKSIIENLCKYSIAHSVCEQLREHVTRVFSVILDGIGGGFDSEGTLSRLRKAMKMS